MADEGHKIFKFKTPDGREYQIGDGGKAFELTPERIEQSIRDQAQRAASSPHLSTTPQMATVIQARREAKMWLDSLKSVEAEMHRPHSKEELKDLKTRFDHLSKNLAEALATCGNFKEALLVLPRHETRLRKTYEALDHAVWRDDDERCGEKCATETLQNPNRVTGDYIHSWVWSHKHGRLISVVACASCGDLNARPLDGTLARLHNARVQADKLIKGQDPTTARQTLTDAGLTVERIL